MPSDTKISQKFRPNRVGETTMEKNMALIPCWHLAFSKRKQIRLEARERCLLCTLSLIFKPSQAKVQRNISNSWGSLPSNGSSQGCAYVKLRIYQNKIAFKCRFIPQPSELLSQVLVLSKWISWILLDKEVNLFAARPFRLLTCNFAS